MDRRRVTEADLMRPIILAALLLAMAAVVFGQAGPTSRSIVVITEPNSIVWIDSVRYGVTDANGRLAIAAVPPGVRAIRVRAAGFSEMTKSLPAASRGDVPIKLTRTTDEAELAYQSAESMTTVDRQKAIAEYERAIKLRPKFPEAYLGLARMYAETSDFEKALKAISSAKRLKPGYAEASAVEGRLLKDTGEEDKAIAVFNRSIKEARGFQPEAYTGIGLLYKDRAEGAASGNYEEEAANYDAAVKHLAVAVKQLGGAPDNMVVIQLLGLIYERQKKFKEAIALYEGFLKTFPNSSEAGAVESFIVQIRKQMAEPR